MLQGVKLMVNKISCHITLYALNYEFCMKEYVWIWMVTKRHILDYNAFYASIIPMDYYG
jgi:hypothetical protein